MDAIKTNKAVKIILFLAIMMILGYYVLYNPELLRIIKGAKLKYIYALVVVDLLFLLINGLILKVFLQFFNLHLTINECMGVSVFASIGNYLTLPGGGIISKGFYLKKRHCFPYSSFVALISTTGFINMFLACVIGAGAIAVLGFMSTTFLELMFWLFISLGVFLSIVLFTSYKPKMYPKRIFNRMDNIIKGYNLIKGNKGLLSKISFLLLINYLLCAVDLMLCYRAFSIDVSFVYTLLLSAIVLLAGIIKIVPGNIGIYEGSIALSSQMLGIGLGQGLLAAGLSRIVFVMVTLTLGAMFGPVLLKKKSGVNKRGSSEKKGLYEIKYTSDEGL